MAPENAIAPPSKKDKKSKRKSLGDVTTAPIEVDTSLSTSKPSKKRKKDVVAEEVEVPVEVPEAQPEKAVKKGKKKAKSVDIDISAEVPEEGSANKSKKSDDMLIADGSSPSKAEGLSKNAKKKIARKGKESEVRTEDAVVEPIKEKGKKSAKVAKVIEEFAETSTEEAEVNPKKATKAGKEKATIQNDDVEKPTKAKKGRNVEDKKKDATTATETAPTRSKSKKTQPTPALVEEPTVVEEAEPKKKKKGKKESAAEEKVVEIPEPTIVAPEITPSKDVGKKAKKTKDAKKSAVASTAPEVAHISASVDPTPSMISTVKPPKKTKKTTAKKPSPEPEPATLSDDEAVEVNGELDSDDEDAHLHGFSTDDDDSSDEEDGMDFEPSAFDVSKLPTIAKDDATVKRKLDKAKRQPTDDRGVLFLGRLPHGFFEDQMKAYFSQFGTVTRIRLSRNKKTGRSKHYGFVEFDSSSVAQIVADTMDNYLIMGHILRCKVIPNDEVHPELWVGANRKWRSVPRDRVTRVEHNKPRTEDEQVRAAKRLIKRQNDRKRKLADTGIKYDFEAVSYKKAKEVEA